MTLGETTRPKTFVKAPQKVDQAVFVATYSAGMNSGQIMINSDNATFTVVYGRILDATYYLTEGP